MSKLKCFIQYVYIHFVQTFIHNELRYVVDSDEYEQFIEWRKNKKVYYDMEDN